MVESGVVDAAVVEVAEQAAVVGGGVAAVFPGDPVVGLGPFRWPVAAGEGAAAVAGDQGALIAPSQKIAPRVRFGISATRMRPAISARIPDKKARNGVSSRWSVRGCGIHASVGASAG